MLSECPQNNLREVVTQSLAERSGSDHLPEVQTAKLFADSYLALKRSWD